MKMRAERWEGTLGWAFRWWMWAALLIAGAGCKTTPLTPVPEGASSRDAAVVLREGDVVSITFPGTPALGNQIQQIRRDGKITLQSVGEVSAVGLTPDELQKQVLKLYENQLVNKEALVVLQSSQYPVFVSGAVLRPGKVVADRPIDVLEAIMEAGGFDNARANLKAVRIVRNEKGEVKKFTINVDQNLKGEGATVFYLRPSDIVYVPEKMPWF